MPRLFFAAPDGRENTQISVQSGQGATRQEAVLIDASDVEGLPDGAAVLTNIRYVDVGTTVLPADQTGSMAAPFSDLQSALDSIGAASSAILWVAPGAYGLQPTVVPAPTFEAIAIQSLGYVPQTAIGFIGNSPRLVQLPNIDATAFPGLNLTLAGCEFATVAMPVAPALSVVTLIGCQAITVTDATECAWFGCLVTAPTGSESLYFEQCAMGGVELVAGLQVEIVDCRFPVGTPPSVTFSGAPGVLNMDGASCSDFFSAAGTLTNGELIVRNRPKQATIAVTVGANATDALIYVDVSTVGTLLEGIGVGDLVVANPLADLRGAGTPGGGFINARVSAADTIRCAFHGTLTAGTYNFAFGVLS